VHIPNGSIVCLPGFRSGTSPRIRKIEHAPRSPLRGGSVCCPLGFVVDRSVTQKSADEAREGFPNIALGVVGRRTMHDSHALAG
jgi:hypothetical protein